MTHKNKLTIVIFAGLIVVHAARAEQLDRLSADQLEVLAPSSRVAGPPGQMRVTERSCRAPTEVGLRRRIVDIAVQEWAYFGFGVVDETNRVDSERPQRRTRRRTPWLNPEESARVAETIAGYWSITSDGSWILSRQNAVWNGQDGVASRWRDPWSAAFISWVMCESGLGDAVRFRLAIAHHTYIDQAIEARDSQAADAAFVAYDIGETPVAPGDLLCSGRRPVYRSLAERRRELGTGIRSHCDIVIEVDAANERILVIGGNVRGAVSLKLLPAAFGQNRGVEGAIQSVGRGRRAAFAHLKLRADPIQANALETSPTIRTFGQQQGALDWLRQRLRGQGSNRVEVVSTSAPPAGAALPGRPAAL